jgi:hypothetical protein
MNIAVVTYSLTGNNARLGKSIAEAIGATYIEVQTEKPVTNGKIFQTLVFGVVPKAKPEPASITGFGKILFVAPIWMGMAAFPLRPYLRAAGKAKKPYGFLSISGGADSDNPTMESDLKKRAGHAPELLLDQHIRTLLPAEPKPTREMTSAYQVTDSDLEALTAAAVGAMKKSGFLER